MAQVQQEARLRIITAYVIVIAWAGSFIAGLVLPEYNPHPTIHGLMMVLAGSLFTPSIWREIGNARRGEQGSQSGDVGDVPPEPDVRPEVGQPSPPAYDPGDGINFWDPGGLGSPTSPPPHEGDEHRG